MYALFSILREYMILRELIKVKILHKQIDFMAYVVYMISNSISI